MYTQWPKLLRFFKVKHNISIKMSHRTQLPARLCRCGRSRVWGFWRTPPPLPSWEPPQTSTNCLFSGCVLEAQHPPVCSPVGLRAWMLQVTALWKLSTTVFPPLILLPCWVHGLARVDWRRQVLEGMLVCAGMGVGRSGLGCHDRQQHVWKHSVSPWSLDCISPTKLLTPGKNKEEMILSFIHLCLQHNCTMQSLCARHCTRYKGYTMINKKWLLVPQNIMAWVLEGL